MAPLAPQQTTFNTRSSLGFLDTPKFATGLEGNKFVFKDGTTGSKTDFLKYTPPVKDSFDWTKVKFDPANAPKVTGAMSGQGVTTETTTPLPVTTAPEKPAVASMEGRKNVQKKARKTSIMDSIIPQASASGDYNDIDLENLQTLKNMGVTGEDAFAIVDEKKAMREGSKETSPIEEAPKDEGFKFEEYLPTAPKFQIDTTPTAIGDIAGSNLKLAENMIKTVGNVPSGIWNTFSGTFNALVNTAKDPEGMANALTEGIKAAYVEGTESVADTYNKSGSIGVLNKALEKATETLGENPFETITVVKPTIGLDVMKGSAKIATAPIGATGTAIKKTGEALYKTAIKPTTQEAELLLRSKAGLGKTPTTMADTALKSGIKGTETRIGVQALKKADEIFSKQISPLLDKSKTTHGKAGILEEVRRKIVSDKSIGDLRKKELLSGFEALKEDFQGIKTKFTTKDLQIEKSKLDEFTPSKVWKGQDVAGGYNKVKTILANVMRERVRDDLGKLGLNAKEAYRDYANLQELSKIGIKGLTDAGFKGGFGGFWTTMYEQATTPIKTIGGQVLYKVGDKLEFIGPKGINKLGDYLKDKISITKDGILSSKLSDNVNNTMNSGFKAIPGDSKSALKPNFTRKK